MRGGGAAVLLGLLLVSCGLETVPSLSAPPARYDSDLVTTSQLSFVHEASRYSGSDFLSYLVYYRIYPAAPTITEAFGRLTQDRDKLASSPTVSQLAGLGYQPMTVSASPSGTGARNLEITPAADGTKVTLDFSSFLQTPGSLPVLLLNGTAPDAANLFRTANIGSIVGFDDLRTSLAQRVDMAPPDSNAPAKTYEINVFVVAYGLSDTLTEVYSVPVPWGVVSQVKPF